MWTATSTDSSGLQPQIDQQTLEKMRLENEKAALELERLKMQVLSEAVKPLEGKIAIDDKFVLPVQILAYEQVSRIAQRMADEIANADEEKKLSTIVLLEEKDVAAILTCRAAREQLKLLSKEYEDIVNLVPVPPPAPRKGVAIPVAAPLAAGALKALFDVAALFRSDVEFKGVSMDVDHLGIASEFVRSWKKKRESGTVVYPALAIGLTVPTKSALMDAIEECRRQRAMAETAVSKSPGKAAEDRLKAANAQADGLMKYLETVDEKTGLSPLIVLVRAETLETELQADGSAALFVKALAGGGANKTTRSLIRTRLFHSGGAVVACLLIDRNGDILLGRTLCSASPYEKSTSRRGTGLWQWLSPPPAPRDNFTPLDWIHGTRRLVLSLLVLAGVAGSTFLLASLVTWMLGRPLDSESVAGLALQALVSGLIAGVLTWAALLMVREPKPDGEAA